MVTKKNIYELVNQLLSHVRLSNGQYRDDLIIKIITMCTQDKYKLLTNNEYHDNLFLWFSKILEEFMGLHDTIYGKRILKEMVELAMRVMINEESLRHAWRVSA